MKISIEEVKRINAEKGYYYFSQDTMRFFSSRVSTIAYKVGNKAFFITSEQNKLTTNNRRKWSIRLIDLSTGKIRTIGEFQGFNSNREAKNRLKQLLKALDRVNNNTG